MGALGRFERLSQQFFNYRLRPTTCVSAPILESFDSRGAVMRRRCPTRLRLLTVIKPTTMTNPDETDKKQPTSQAQTDYKANPHSYHAPVTSDR